MDGSGSAVFTTNPNRDSRMGFCFPGYERPAAICRRVESAADWHTPVREDAAVETVLRSAATPDYHFKRLAASFGASANRRAWRECSQPAEGFPLPILVAEHGWLDATRGFETELCRSSPRGRPSSAKSGR